MIPRPRHGAAFVRGIVLFCLSIVTIATAHATADSTSHPRETILFVGNLNFDCYPDTVSGTMAGMPGSYLPRTIRWGRPSPSDSACQGMIPLDRRVAVTTIHYPDWDRFSGSVAFNRMNDDSLDDMTLFIRGSVGDSLHRTDSLRALVIFSQAGLDSLPVLDVAAIDAFQVTPFFAMELRKGSELVEPEVRDISGVTSYVIQPVSLDVGGEHQDTTIVPGDSTPAQPIRIRVYPNPTGGAAQVQIDSIPPGDYSVDVVAVNGFVVLHQSVSVPIAGTLFQTLDLHALPVGYYVVRVTSGTQIFGLYPIIITR
jgi:hypothetical protein